MTGLLVRKFENKDAAATAQIFFDAIHIGAKDHYTEKQRRAWAPQVPETSKWLELLNSQISYVAEQEGKLVGFMILMDDGCVDLTFVTPERIGQGISKVLYDSIIMKASKAGMKRLHVEASHMARKFFERQGWSVINPQTVERAGVSLENFLMQKEL